METIEATSALLREVADQWKEHKRRQQETGEAFNIFSILDRERKEESTHCRLLYELLNSKGSHGKKDAFLKEFFKTVLDKEKRFPGCEKVEVYREYSFSDGRIDLLVMGKNFCYPIEVKIDADDQDRQLERYAKFARDRKDYRSGYDRKDFDFQVYYLTLDGHSPSGKGLGKEDDSHISCISFERDILLWLNRCTEITKDHPNLDVILHQYIRLLEKLTNYWGGDLYMDKIANLVGSSKENYESAVAVANVLAYVREQKIQAVFQTIEESLKKFGLQGDTISGKNQERSYACPILSDKEYRVELWFQLSADNGYNLVYGVVLQKTVDGEPRLISTPDELSEFADLFSSPTWREMILEHIKHFETWKEKGCWWIWERNILGESGPLYLKPTDLEADLFDPDYFEGVLERIKKEIEKQVPHIQNTGVFQ